LQISCKWQYVYGGSTDELIFCWLSFRCIYNFCSWLMPLAICPTQLKDSCKCHLQLKISCKNQWKILCFFLVTLINIHTQIPLMGVLMYWKCLVEMDCGTENVFPQHHTYSVQQLQNITKHCCIARITSNMIVICIHAPIYYLVCGLNS
jgi:hypothetical protein